MQQQGGDIQFRRGHGWPPAEQVPSTFQWTSESAEVRWSGPNPPFEASWSSPLVNSFPQAHIAEGDASIEMRADGVQIVGKIISDDMFSGANLAYLHWYCTFDLLVAPRTDSELIGTSRFPRNIEHDLIARNGVFIFWIKPTPHLWKLSLTFSNNGTGEILVSRYASFYIEAAAFPTENAGW